MHIDANTRVQYGLLIARVGLAGVLLWFGAQQLIAPSYWLGYLPDWAASLGLIAGETIVLLNGGVEVLFGTFLLLGLFTRLVSFVMGIHLAGIAFSLGFNEIAIRDWGLAAGYFCLALAGGGTYALDTLLGSTSTPQGTRETDAPNSQ